MRSRQQSMPLASGFYSVHIHHIVASRFQLELFLSHIQILRLREGRPSNAERELHLDQGRWSGTLCLNAVSYRLAALIMRSTDDSRGQLHVGRKKGVRTDSVNLVKSV